MKAFYFEFSEDVVKNKMAPAPLCSITGRDHDSRMFDIINLATRVYFIAGDTIMEVKNRNEKVGTIFISDEDKIILKLQAVPWSDIV